jgi:hypothetical protein
MIAERRGNVLAYETRRDATGFLTFHRNELYFAWALRLATASARRVHGGRQFVRTAFSSMP